MVLMENVVDFRCFILKGTVSITYMKNTLIKDILQENSLLDEFSIEPPISSSLDSLMFKIKLVDAVKILA